MDAAVPQVQVDIGKPAPQRGRGTGVTPTSPRCTGGVPGEGIELATRERHTPVSHENQANEAFRLLPGDSWGTRSRSIRNALPTNIGRRIRRALRVSNR